MSDALKNSLKVLAINHIDENPEDSVRIVISPATVKMVASKDMILNGRDLKLISIHYIDGECVGFNVSAFDLMTLEEVIGGYSFGEY